MFANQPEEMLKKTFALGAVENQRWESSRGGAMRIGSNLKRN